MKKDNETKNIIKLMDAAEQIAKCTDLCELIDQAYDLAYFDCLPLSEDDIEYLRKKYRYEEVIERLCHFNGELEIELDSSYSFFDFRNVDTTQKFLHDEGRGVFTQLSMDVFDNFTRLLKNEELLMGIKDRKFQHYLQIRKNMTLLKCKLDKDRPNIADYAITTINTILEKVDMYLLSYLMNILILANQDNIISLISNLQKNLI